MAEINRNYLLEMNRSIGGPLTRKEGNRTTVCACLCVHMQHTYAPQTSSFLLESKQEKESCNHQGGNAPPSFDRECILSAFSFLYPQGILSVPKERTRGRGEGGWSLPCCTRTCFLPSRIFCASRVVLPWHLLVHSAVPVHYHHRT